MAELITLRARPRGKGAKDKPDIEFQGLGRVVKNEDGSEEVVTEGVLSTVEEALSLPGIEGNLQRALDFLVVGYNRYQREQAADVDEFAPYLQADWDEKRIDAFKRSVRALVKAVGNPDIMDTDAAAKLVLSKMEQAAVAQ